MRLVKFVKYLMPSGKWFFPATIIFGIFWGLVAFILHISKATSYLSDSPKTCVNCHVMAPQYATWNHSSHARVTNCNDCHVPHNNIFNKYYFKAKDGIRHATIFTLRSEPQVIFIKEEGRKVVQENCIRCHKNLLTDDKLLFETTNYHYYRMDRNCWECHREIPHGRVNSLSSVPNAKVPLPESPVPEWLSRLILTDK